MTKEEADKLLNHYFPDLDKKTKNRILRFAATYCRELRIKLDVQNSKDNKR